MSWQTDVERLRAQTCIKWNRFAADVIPAWVADMDIPPVPSAADAIRGLADLGDLGYNFNAAAAIPRVFVERQERLFGWRPVGEIRECRMPWEPEVEHVRLFCDVMQAVEVALWLHTQPGDGVVLFTPVYHPFFAAIDACKCRLVDVPLDRDGWRLDPERLEAAIDDGTRVILTCNPHNPTGRSFSLPELTAIAEIAEKHELLVISDEIWADLTYLPLTHVPLASISPEAAARTITIAAASKAFNLAGMRCAVAHIGHEGLDAKIAELPGHVLGAVGSPGAEATLAAWTRGEAWLAETLRHLQATRDHLEDRLTAELPELGFVPPEATYLAWLDFSAYGLGDDPAKELLERAKVALSSGLEFGPEGAGFARLNFATTGDLIDEIVDRIVSAVRR